MNCEMPRRVERANRGMVGSSFGRWTVLSFCETRFHASYWRCVCECGTERVIIGQSLKNGQSKSCGCLLLEMRTKHGMRYTRVYKIWRGIIERCNPKNTSNRRYSHNYAARGIGVCDRWKDFTNFYADMGDPPSGMSIDRIDNDGDYEPGNCRWASDLEQANNKRTNRRIEVNGEVLTVTEAARKYGISAKTITMRLNNGLSGQDAATRPVAPRRRREEKRE